MANQTCDSFQSVCRYFWCACWSMLTCDCLFVCLSLYLFLSSFVLVSVSRTFFCSMQWKMKMNMPCRELKMVKRYAMITVLSLMYIRPKAQVRPSRHSRAMAPITQDLQKREDRLDEEGLIYAKPNTISLATVAWCMSNEQHTLLALLVA